MTPGAETRRAVLASARQLEVYDTAHVAGAVEAGSSFHEAVHAWLEAEGQEISLGKSVKGPSRAWAIKLGNDSGTVERGGEGTSTNKKKNKNEKATGTATSGNMGTSDVESSQSRPSLFVFQEVITEKTSTCDQCRIIGWGTHPVSTMRYHFIIPAETGPDSLADGKSLVAVTEAARLHQTHSMPSFHLPSKPSMEGNVAYGAQATIYDSVKHRLHGVVHANGYGHLLRVNGVYGGSTRMTGLQIFALWDGLCEHLRVHRVTVEDVSSKSNMELRIAYLLAYGCTWYGLLGYGFGRGPYNITEKRWNEAISYVSGINLSQLLFDFRGVEDRVVGVVERYCRAVEGAVEVRDFGALMYRLMFLQLNPDQAVRFFSDAGTMKLAPKKMVFPLKVAREESESGREMGRPAKASKASEGGVKERVNLNGTASQTNSKKHMRSTAIKDDDENEETPPTRAARATRSARALAGTANTSDKIASTRRAVAVKADYEEYSKDDFGEEDADSTYREHPSSPVFTYSTKRGTRSVIPHPKVLIPARTVNEYIKQSVDNTVDALWRSAVCPSDDEDGPVVPRAWHGMEPGADVEDPNDTQEVRNQITADLHLLFMCTLKMYVPDVAKSAGQIGAIELGQRHIAKIVKGKHISREVGVLRDTKHFVKTYRSTDVKQMHVEMRESGEPQPGTIRVRASLVMPEELTSPDTSTRSGKKAMLPVQPPVELIDMPSNATVGDFLHTASKRYCDLYALCKHFKAIGAYVSVQKDDDNPKHPMMKKQAAATEVFLPEKTKLKTLPPMKAPKMSSAQKTSTHSKRTHQVVLGMDVAGIFGSEVKIEWMLHAGGAQDWTVNCPCGTIDDDGAEMVACTKCETWFHTRCVKPDATGNAWAKAYTCNRCAGIAMLTAPRY